jgi:molybdopterin-guanine dinucleotide biosynthesis protein A
MIEMLRIPGMLLVGAAGRNVGKTELACRIIKHFVRDHEVIGLKVTVIRDDDRTCPRGGEGCGVCTSLEGDYDITEETELGTGKDTSKLLGAGATRVLWLRVMKTHLIEGMTELLNMIGDDAVSVCESNSLRTAVEPGLFLMVNNQASGKYKESADEVKAYADRIVISGDGEFGIDFADLDVVGGRWVLREHATAIVLAGGESERMKKDKTMLPVDGQPMIERVCDRLKETFDQVLVSANDPEKYAFLGLEVAPDKTPGQGPLMGIASALEASANEVNLVVASDMPDVDVPYARRLLAESDGYDAVVPRGSDGQVEPLLAVYRKSLADKMFEMIRSGERRIRSVFEHCRTKYVDLPDAEVIRNLNTVNEYEEYTGGS